jgi:hypothetical protein
MTEVEFKINGNQYASKSIFKISRVFINDVMKEEYVAGGRGAGTLFFIYFFMSKPERYLEEGFKYRLEGTKERLLAPTTSLEEVRVR